MISKDTYRPREVEWKSDGISEAWNGDIGAEINDVLAQNGCDDVAVCARRRRVDLHLILFQADPEPGLTNAWALTGLGSAAWTALAKTVFSIFVHEWLQPQLEHPRSIYLKINRVSFNKNSIKRTIIDISNLINFYYASIIK